MVGGVNLQQGLFDLAVVSLLAAITPIVAGLLSRLRIPQVVILIIGGVVVEPAGPGRAGQHRADRQPRTRVPVSARRL